LKELLRLKLAESGWRDQLKEHCKVRPHMPARFLALTFARHPDAIIFLN
jgi:hypothetical protein